MMQRPPASGDLAGFVERLQSAGRYTFDRREALAALRVSEIALQAAVRRLSDKGKIVVPRRGFYVTVPAEYRHAGAPPADWFIDALMKFQGHEYYVGLLSAAAIHGAAHQQPQEMQVVTDDKSLRPIQVGRIRIRFFYKKRLGQTSTVRVETETGSMAISSREATAFDLVRYVKSSGQLANVATVLAELAEKIDPRRLLESAQNEELAVIQRAAYLLDRFAASKLTGLLSEWLAAKHPRPVPLRPTRVTPSAKRDNRWNVIINEEIEIDE